MAEGQMIDIVASEAFERRDQIAADAPVRLRDGLTQRLVAGIDDRLLAGRARRRATWIDVAGNNRLLLTVHNEDHGAPTRTPIEIWW